LVYISKQNKIIMKKLFLIPALALFAFGFTACTDEEETPELKSIVEIATTTPGFDSLVVALSKAGLVDDLSGDGPFTVFAPTNQAFVDLLDALSLNSIDELIATLGAPAVTNVLLYHVVAGKILSTDLTDEQEVTPLLATSTFTIDLTGGPKIVDENALTTTPANITGPDNEASNGVIHVIDAIILPNL